MPRVTTQQFIEIDQIREGVIILKDKTLRGVLMISSLNFALKADEEQTAILYQFQNLLNSLDFSCQIVVQSRRINITGYLDMLKSLEEKQENELLQVQTRGYREFIESFIKEGTIMTKNFYVVVPFYPSPLEFKKTAPAAKTQKEKTVSSLTEENFQMFKNQLWQRMEFLALSLKRCGLQTIPLITNELIELFWGLHHPKEAEFGYYPEIPPELIQ
jgi:type IV secretory pathway VirB4 component